METNALMKTEDFSYEREGKMKKLYFELHNKLKELNEKHNQLKRNADKYRTIFQNVSEFVYIHDMDGNFIETNIYYLKEMGYHPNDEKKYKIQDLIPDRFKAHFEQYLLRLRKSGREKGDMTVLTKNGEERNFAYNSTLIQNDAGEYLVQGIARDITDQKQAEKELRASEARYRSIIEKINDGYFEVNLAGTLTYCNDALCELAGYAKEEIIGKNNQDYSTPETAKRMFRIFNRIYQTGKSEKILDFDIIRKDGSIGIFELSASLIQDVSNIPVGFRGIVRDVTERIQAEKERSRNERMQGVLEMAGAVCHELNQPMQVISGLSEILLMDAPPNSAIDEQVEQIKKQIDRMSQITKKLMSITKYETKNYIEGRKIIDIDKSTNEQSS